MHPSIRQIDFAVQLGINDLRLAFSNSYLMQQRVRQVCLGTIGPCGLNVQIGRKVAQACVDVLINGIFNPSLRWHSGFMGGGTAGTRDLQGKGVNWEPSAVSHSAEDWH